MDIKPIRTEEDYLAALAEIEANFDAEPGTPEGDNLDILVALVEAYEEKHHPIPLPDPIEAIEFHMERLGLTRKDLEPWVGNRARVSEVLNRKRSLSIRMIRNLSKGLGIPPEILIQEYPTSNEPDNEIEVGTNEEEVLNAWLSEFGNLVKVFMNLSAGNELKNSLPEILRTKLQNLNRDITNTTAGYDCFYVKEAPILIYNWPFYSTDNCEADQTNQTGNSYLQRIVQ